MCNDHAVLRQVGDVCMQPVCDADSDVMIVYQDNIRGVSPQNKCGLFFNEYPVLVVIFTQSFTTNAMTSGFLWLSGNVPRLPSYRIYISQIVRFARCCTSVFDIHSKKYSNHFKTFDTGLQISQASEKHLESPLGLTLNFCPNLVQYRFRNMYHTESSTRSSMVILSTNLGRSKAKRISSRGARK